MVLNCSNYTRVSRCCQCWGSLLRVPKQPKFTRVICHPVVTINIQLCFIKKICYWTSTQQIITRGILWRDIWNSSDEIVLSSDEKCWLPDVLLAWHTAWKVPAADNFLSCACGAGRKGRSPFCWINKSIIKSELIKDKGVESGRVQ